MATHSRSAELAADVKAMTALEVALDGLPSNRARARVLTWALDNWAEPDYSVSFPGDGATTRTVTQSPGAVTSPVTASPPEGAAA